MISEILLWYFIGVVLAGIGNFLYEYFYYYEKELKYISKSEVITDVLLSLLSWVMVFITLIILVVDIITKWPSKGVARKIKRNEYFFIGGGRKKAVK